MLLQRVCLSKYSKSYNYTRLIATTSTTNQNVLETHSSPPRNARVVVCGGGVLGASVIYHIAKLGWAADTVLIDQNK